MINKTKFSTVIAVLSFISACGGGGGGGTTTPSNSVSENPDVITGVVLNPSLAVQRVYQFSGTTTSGQYRYQYSQGANEVINGTQFNVQNLITVDAAGNAITTKRYYTNTPFRIYTPPTSFYSDCNYQIIPPNTVDAYYKTCYSIVNTFSLGELPTSAKVGDFGTYLTSTSRAESILINRGTFFDLPGVMTSVWTLEKYDQSTAGLCLVQKINRDCR